MIGRRWWGRWRRSSPPAPVAEKPVEHVHEWRGRRFDVAEVPRHAMFGGGTVPGVHIWLECLGCGDRRITMEASCTIEEARWAYRGDEIPAAIATAFEDPS